MEDTLLFEEEETLKEIRESNSKKSINDLNKKKLSNNELEELFCEY